MAIPPDCSLTSPSHDPRAPSRADGPGGETGLIIDGELADLRGRSMEEYSEVERWEACNMTPISARR